MKDYKVIDTHYSNDEGNIDFVGTYEECMDYKTEQSKIDSNSFMLVIEPLNENELRLYNEESPNCWGVRDVQFQNQNFCSVSRLTTENDDFGGIKNMIDLFIKPHKVNNGFLSSIVSGDKKRDASLIEFIDGSFTLWINGIYINLPSNSMKFSEIY